MLIDYGAGKWSQWETTYPGTIFTVKLWKSLNGEWQIKEKDFSEFHKVPESADVTLNLRANSTTYIRPTCEEIKRQPIIPDEIIKVKRQIER